MKKLLIASALCMFGLCGGCGDSGPRVPDQEEIDKIVAANAEARAATERSMKEKYGIEPSGTGPDKAKSE